MQINVEGGTGAGRRIVKQLPVWECCGGKLTAYSCPFCGRRRVDADVTVKRAEAGEE